MKQTDVIVEEVKTRVAKRIPPGDRWGAIFETADGSLVFDSLTDVLEYTFQSLGNTQFYMDAREGYVYIVDNKEKVVEVEPEKKYSLYGEY